MYTTNKYLNSLEEGKKIMKIQFNCKLLIGH